MAFLGGALSSLSGMMGNVGQSAPAIQEYKANIQQEQIKKQQIEEGRMKALMEKQQMKKDEDFSKTLDSAVKRGLLSGNPTMEKRLGVLMDIATQSKNEKMMMEVSKQQTAQEDVKVRTEAIQAEKERTREMQRQFESDKVNNWNNINAEKEKAAADKKSIAEDLLALKKSAQEQKGVAAQEKSAKKEQEGMDAATILKAGGIVSRGQKTEGVDQLKKQYPQLSDMEIGVKVEQAGALNKSIYNQELMRGKIGSFEKTALGNLGQIEKEIEKLRDSGKTNFPVMNVLIDKWKKQSGQTYNEGINLFGQESASELAKLASSTTGAGTGGTLSDREEWRSFFDKDGSFAQMKKSLDSAKTSVGIRIKSQEDQLRETREAIRQLWPEGKQKTQSYPDLPAGFKPL